MSDAEWNEPLFTLPQAASEYLAPAGELVVILVSQPVHYEGVRDGILSRTSADGMTVHHYPFSGEIGVDDGVTTMIFEIQDHPEISGVEAQFAKHGFEGFLVVEAPDGTRAVHYLPLGYTGR